MSALQIKKKWENLKQKYKVRFFLIIIVVHPKMRILS